MQKKSPVIAVIDIGTTKICALVARQNNDGKFHILGKGIAESKGVKRGVISNISKTVEGIREAVEKAEKRSGHPIKKVYVGIASKHINSIQRRGYVMRNNIDDEISQKDIDQLVADMHKMLISADEEIIHVLPQGFIVDNEQGITDPKGMAGVRLEADFNIITGQSTSIRSIYRCIEKAGLEVVELILEPLASAKAILSEQEVQSGVAIVDIGGGTTDLAIFKDGFLRHTNVLSHGGKIVTSDIANGCQVLEEQAEKLKVKFGHAIGGEAPDNSFVAIKSPLREREPKEISMRQLSLIIQARMEEILELVVQEIENTGFLNQLVFGIVITGGGAKLKYLKDLVEYMAATDVRIGLPIEYLNELQKKDYNDPKYATVIGLALKALEKNPVSTSEISKPAEYSNSLSNEKLLADNAPQAPVNNQASFSNRAITPSSTNFNLAALQNEEQEVASNYQTAAQANVPKLSTDIETPEEEENENENKNFFQKFIRSAKTWLEDDLE